MALHAQTSQIFDQVSGNVDGCCCHSLVCDLRIIIGYVIFMAMFIGSFALCYLLDILLRFYEKFHFPNIHILIYVKVLTVGRTQYRKDQ